MIRAQRGCYIFFFNLFVHFFNILSHVALGVNFGCQLDWIMGLEGGGKSDTQSINILGGFVRGCLRGLND